MRHYPLPNFKALEPNFLAVTVREIQKLKIKDEKECVYNSVDKYKIALEKFIKKMPISKREYLSLLYYLHDLIELGYFTVFIEQFEKEINNFKFTASFCYPLLKFIYNNFNKGKERLIVYNLLQKLLKANQHKRRLKKVISLVNESKDIFQYLGKIIKKYRQISNIDEIKNLSKEYCLNTTDKFYHHCISDFIVNNHQKTEFWDFLSSTVKSMDLELKKKILEQIILHYKNAVHENEFHNEWFALIKDQLHDPFIARNTLWDGISEEAINIYRRWNVLKNIYKFFMEISGGDRRRLNYWRGHLNNIYNIEYFEELNKALVMEFPNHTIIEFAEANNACYIYPKAVINLQELYRVSKSYISHREKMKYVKNNDKSIKKLRHYDQWEWSFDKVLRQMFGYTRGR